MRGVHAAGKETPGLHHLMAGVMHSGSRVITASDQRKFVGNFCVKRKYLRNLNVGAFGLDWLERAPNFPRRFGLHIPGIQLAWGTQVEDHDGGLLVVAFRYGSHGLESGIF